MTATPQPSRSQIDPVPPRIVVAVHGYEHADWAQETCRVLSTWASSAVRVLAVLDVPSPPFTSLTTFARHAYAAARAQWIDDERHRLERSVEALLSAQPHPLDVTWAPAVRGDLARTIAEEARAWPADVVVVGRPTPAAGSWPGPGAVHERVVRLAGCTVLVVTPRLAATTGSRARAVLPRTAAAGQRA